MTKESLQEYCNSKKLQVKILYIEEHEEYNDYEVVYTFDLSYKGRDYSNLDKIIEPELDELCENEEDFYYMVCEEIKHGKWVKEWRDGFVNGKRNYELICPYCNFSYFDNQCGFIVPEHFNFCPNCGAKMDGDNGE